MIGQGDPPYPAAARQYHGQAVTLAPGAPGAVKMSQPEARTPRIIRAGPSRVKGT